MTWDDLRRDPAEAGPCPHSHEGHFHRGGDGGSLSPVTWHTLARYGVLCRGPKPADAGVWADPMVLTAWVDDNLDQYWRRLCDQAARLFSPWGLTALTPYATVWIVTGVSRLHYTLATGDVISKEGAGRYALEAFPGRWHQVVAESLRIRRADRARPTISSAPAGAREFLRVGRADHRSLYRTPLGRRRDVLAFADMVITDAHRVYVDRDR